MNLLLFTIELEPGDRHDAADSRDIETRRGHRRRRIGLAILTALCVVAAGLGGWLLSGGRPTSLEDGWVGLVAPTVSAEGNDQARLELVSQPAGASVTLDGRRRGSTPLVTAVAPGVHTLVLQQPDALDEQRQISVTGNATIDISMWLHTPTSTLLKPAYPGATIGGAAFLDDGRLALQMAVPAASTNANERAVVEPWVYDPRDGSLTRLTTQTTSIRAANVSISPDGHEIAYVTPDASAVSAASRAARLTEVWIASAETQVAAPQRVFALPSANATSTAGSATPADIEEVHDVTWTPDGRHLLVTVRLAAIASGAIPAPRTRLLLVSASPDAMTLPTELMTLPAELVVRSYTWAPDGNWVAFLTQAPAESGGSMFVALCALDTSAGGALSGFRYVADLGRSSVSGGPIPAAAATWSPTGDGRLVYAASTPKVTVTNPLGLPTTTGGEPGLFVATPAGQALTAEEGRRLGAGAGLSAPTWASVDEVDPGNLLALARSTKGSKPLVMRGIDSSSGALHNLEVSLPPGVGGSGPVAARWDLGHGRLLVLARHDNTGSGLLDYWLVDLQARAAEH